MTTGTPGDAARLFARQQTHYLVRGGGNDPYIPATGGPPVTTAGAFGFASVLTLPPIPGAASQAPRVMSINSTTGILAANVLGTNNGGVLIGTLPQGAWINSIQMQVLTAFAGGTNDSFGVFYAPAGSAYPVASLWTLATMTTLTAGLYGSPGGTNITALTTAQLGFGSGVNDKTQLASIGDIDIYAVTYKAAGTGTAFTSGQAAVMIEFSGTPG